jgi:hypothetical protein
LKIKSLFSGLRGNSRRRRHFTLAFAPLLARGDPERYLLPNKLKQLTHAQFINRRIISLGVILSAGAADELVLSVVCGHFLQVKTNGDVFCSFMNNMKNLQKIRN